MSVFRQARGCEGFGSVTYEMKLNNASILEGPDRERSDLDRDSAAPALGVVSLYDEDLVLVLDEVQRFVPEVTPLLEEVAHPGEERLKPMTGDVSFL